MIKQNKKKRINPNSIGPKHPVVFFLLITLKKIPQLKVDLYVKYVFLKTLFFLAIVKKP